MLETIDRQSILERTSAASFWEPLQLPQAASLASEPTLDVRAGALTAFLELWSREVERALFNQELEWTEGTSQPATAAPNLDQVWSWALASVLNAANTLLSFKRRNFLIDVPVEWLRCANLIFTAAEAHQIQAGDLTIPQVALRFAAATSHLIKSPRPTKIDEQGRIFTLAGERLFQFDPNHVLEGRQEFQGDKSQQTH